MELNIFVGDKYSAAQVRPRYTSTRGRRPNNVRNGAEINREEVKNSQERVEVEARADETISTGAQTRRPHFGPLLKRASFAFIVTSYSLTYFERFSSEQEADES